MRQLEVEPDCEVRGRSLRDWLAWAEGHLKGHDPLDHGVEAIFNSVGSVNEWNYPERKRSY